MSAKIVLLDIETAPNLGWVWGKYDQNVIAFEEHWYMLSFAAKVLGEDVSFVRGLCDYDDYRSDLRNDFHLVSDLWAVLDGADIVVAHNGDAFDIKRSNARFIAHSFPPPSPYKTIDTLKIARKHFKFESNKLNDLGQYLEVGEKIPHVGFKLWRACMAGDLEAWEKMKEYNVQDLVLLEEVYLKLRPWAVSHPNLNLYGDRTDPLKCPNCGSDHVQRRGYSHLVSQVRQRFNCTGCGRWFSGPVVK